MLSLFSLHHQAQPISSSSTDFVGVTITTQVWRMFTPLILVISQGKKQLPPCPQGSQASTMAVCVCGFAGWAGWLAGKGMWLAG
jgi:hypothetical protein